MEKDIKNEDEDDSKIVEIAEEVSKPLTPQQLIHQSKAPLFNTGNRFGKATQGNNINNRQRPGRAASRGR